jgi:hypothetical protein
LNHEAPRLAAQARITAPLLCRLIARRGPKTLFNRRDEPFKPHPPRGLDQDGVAWLKDVGDLVGRAVYEIRKMFIGFAIPRSIIRMAREAPDRNKSLDIHLSYKLSDFPVRRWPLFAKLKHIAENEYCLFKRERV